MRRMSARNLQIASRPSSMHLRLAISQKMSDFSFRKRSDAATFFGPSTKRFPAKGDELVTILLRTVFESSNGGAALTLPILRAVSYCMESRWVDRGLEWIEFFDTINLLELQEQIRALDFCDEGNLEQHLRDAIRRRLVRHFGPAKIAVPKKP